MIGAPSESGNNPFLESLRRKGSRTAALMMFLPWQGLSESMVHWRLMGLGCDSAGVVVSIVEHTPAARNLIPDVLKAVPAAVSSALK